jgi:tetratricopeptide (TPR) repeat protein
MAPDPHSGPPAEAEHDNTIEQNLAWVTEHWQLLAGLAAVLLIGGGIYGFAVRAQREAERAAWQAIAEAEVRHADAPAELAEAYETVASRHTGARATFYAEMRAVSGYFQADQLAEAAESAEAFLKRYPENTFSPQIRTDLAKILEARGRWTAAREEYEAVIDTGVDYLQPEAQLGRARCLEQENKSLEARAAYLTVRDRALERMWPRRIRNAVDLRLLAMAEAQEAATAVTESEPDTEEPTQTPDGAATPEPATGPEAGPADEPDDVPAADAEEPDETDPATETPAEDVPVDEPAADPPADAGAEDPRND